MQKNLNETMAQRIARKLEETFHPVTLAVTDISHRHAGHAGAAPGGETHFELVIVAEAFRGLSRVRQHQLIYDTLAEEMGNPIHALQIRTEAP